MRRRNVIIAAAALTAGGIVAGAGYAVAGGGDDDETQAPITGEALDAATAAALEHLGEGTVTETEINDEDSKYEVEVTLDDGSQVDVQLDENFEVVSSDADEENDDD